MAVSVQQELVVMKMNILERQRSHLQNLLDDADKVWYIRILIYIFGLTGEEKR